MFILYKLIRDIGKEHVLDISILKIGTEEECFEKFKQELVWYYDGNFDKNIEKFQNTKSVRVKDIYSQEHEFKMEEV